MTDVRRAWEQTSMGRGASKAGLSALERLAELGATSRDLTVLFEQGAEVVLNAFGADGLSLYLVNPAADRLEVAYRVGVDSDDAHRFDSVPLRETVAWKVLQDGKPRAFTTRDYSPEVRAILCRSSYRCAAAVALQIRSRPLGCLNLGFRTERQLSDDELALLQLMSAHFAAAIEGQRLLAQQRAVSEANAQLYDELRSTTAELSKMQARLFEQERLASLGEMAAVLAHEIRNPLGVLANGLSLLRTRSTQPPDTKVLFAMAQEVERMNALAADLLDFARPLTLERIELPLPPLLEEVAHAAGRELAIALDVPADLTPVHVDARRLRQALLNVATNAVQAAGTRGQVWLRARADGGEVCIEVDDTGPGIPNELRHRVFEPFFTTKASGTGLGLPLAKRIVELHQGRIELHSRPEGIGTRVRIALPQARD